jgi:hypothetical protein
MVQPHASHRLPINERNTSPRLLVGMTMILVGLLLALSLRQSTPAQSKFLLQTTPTAAATVQAPQQPVLVNGLAVYAVPIVTGPAATVLLQQVQADDRAHVVHDFVGVGKAVATAVGWFRCADILAADQYRGTQVEIEAWLFLTEQERLEAQAACTL